jgi:hypothetical protein
MKAVKFAKLCLFIALFLPVLCAGALAATTVQGDPSSGSDQQRKALGGKLSEIDALLGGIRDNLDKAAALQVRLDEQGAALAEAAGDAAHGSEARSALLEEALRLFNERIAPLIATRVASSVSRELEGYITDSSRLQSDSHGGDGDSLVVSVEEIASALEAAQDAVEAASELTQAMIAACAPPEA